MKDIGDESRSGGDPSPFRNPIFWVVIIAIVISALGYQAYMSAGSRIETLSFRELQKKVEANQVKSITIYDESFQIEGVYKNTEGAEAGIKATGFQSKGNEQFVQSLEPLLVKHDVNYQFKPPSPVWKTLASLLPIILIAALFYFIFMRQIKGAGGGGILSFGKSRAVRVTRDKNRKTFDDVAGVEEAKDEVKEIVSFLKNPEKFEALGGRLPHGVLLIGQPGTGKTLLAKAIAGEADVPFFSISGSDFVEMFVGVGASRVRDLFEQAKTNAPCIIFLDEVDAVGRRRVNDLPGSGQEAAQTLNAILVEMDGFTSDDKVIVLAATNRPDVLDPALLRPGRFDRRINVDLPDVKGREEILKVHVKKVKLGDDVDLSILARVTPSFSGAELENLVNEAALIAAFGEKKAVDMSCLEEARDKVRWGKEKRSRHMRSEDRRYIAFHEAGHALLMKLLPHVTPLHKVTIIPRGHALGATMQLPDRDEYNMSKRRLHGQITVLLGGRAAEEIFLDDITNGAQSDFQQATGLARAMVCEWGMSDALGLVFYNEHKGDSSLIETREYSEPTAERIDDEVRSIIDQSYEEACRLLREHSEEVNLVVEALIEFEVLSREEFDALLDAKSSDAVRELRVVAAKQEADNTSDGNDNSESDEGASDESTEGPASDIDTDDKRPAQEEEPAQPTSVDDTDHPPASDIVERE